MLYPTTGCHVFIADAPADMWGGLPDMSGAFPASGWVEIGEMESIGVLGIEHEIQSEIVADDITDGTAEASAKGARYSTELPLIMGNDPADPGQLLLWRAANESLSYPFKIVFSDGTTVRRWFALVFRMADVFDSANSVIRLEAGLKLTSQIDRSGVA